MLLNLYVENAQRGISLQGLNPNMFMGYKDWYENKKHVGVMFYTEPMCRKDLVFVPHLNVQDVTRMCLEVGIKIAIQPKGNVTIVKENADTDKNIA